MSLATNSIKLVQHEDFSTIIVDTRSTYTRLSRVEKSIEELSNAFRGMEAKEETIVEEQRSLYVKLYTLLAKLNIF